MGEVRRIIILEDDVINKIAAGEVVENPSSVVKELIENSIDAESDKIEVKLSEGGKSLIQVKDNGNGMNKIDAGLSIMRHATSKITNEKDLFAINTLGFRGEALASICAVSRFKIMTRQKEEIKGTEIFVENNDVKIKDCGAEKGTVIIVKDLFYNVPARKKFLRSIEHELSAISDVVTRYALAYPNVSFKLTNNNKTILNTVRTKKGINTIQAIYGQETAKNILEIKDEDELIKIEGYIGKPSIARNDKLRQTIFVNGRYVKSKEISDAVKEGYRSLLFLEREPIFILRITVDLDKIDVNVHPRKEIVKISNIKQISESISTAIKKILSESNLFVEANLETGNARPQHSYSISKDSQATLEINDDNDSSIVGREEIKETGSVFDNLKENIVQKEIETKHIGPFRILGQISKTYILAENAQGLLIVDQHAAEERVNYEDLMKQLKDKAIKKQKLLKPIILELSPSEFEMIIKFREELGNSGFEIDEYGKDNIVVRSMPFIFERPSKSLVSELIDELRELNKGKIEREIEERIIRFSCRKSIKAGEDMTIKEISELIKELDKCELPFTCPHGRPTIIQLSISDIEKKFKRTG